jgi:uncharacterized membrane protein (UPF0127 family)
MRGLFVYSPDARRDVQEMMIGISDPLRVNVLKRCACLMAICFLSIITFAQNCSAESTTGATAIFLDSKGRKLCTFKVELAVTQEEQSRGLMFRKEMPSGSGMLFLNNNDEMHSFWMKNTYIPLDILFINGRHEVKHVHYGAKPLDETHISSRYPVQYILEVNAGRAKQCNITPGTKIQLFFDK